MILTHKIIALDEHGEDPKVMAVLDSEEHAQRVADSYNYMWRDCMITAHVVPNTWKEMNQNPYVENLIQKGYSERECRETAFTGRSKQFPYTIHGKTYQTQEEYDEALSEFLNGMWEIVRKGFASLYTKSHP